MIPIQLTLMVKTLRDTLKPGLRGNIFLLFINSLGIRQILNSHEFVAFRKCT